LRITSEGDGAYVRYHHQTLTARVLSLIVLSLVRHEENVRGRVAMETQQHLLYRENWCLYSCYATSRSHPPMAWGSHLLHALRTRFFVWQTNNKGPHLHSGWSLATSRRALSGQ